MKIVRIIMPALLVLSAISTSIYGQKEDVHVMRQTLSSLRDSLHMNTQAYVQFKQQLANYNRQIINVMNDVKLDFEMRNTMLDKIRDERVNFLRRALSNADFEYYILFERRRHEERLDRLKTRKLVSAD